MKLLEIYHDKVIGAIKGLDRIRFRGTLRGLSDSIGINMFMSATGLLLKDFKNFVKDYPSIYKYVIFQKVNKHYKKHIFLEENQ